MFKSTFVSFVFILFQVANKSSNILCNVHSTSQASSCCTECEQALCDHCITFHGKSKTSIDHETRPVVSYLKLPLFVTSRRRKCSKHAGEKSDFYCPEHKSLCCFLLHSWCSQKLQTFGTFIKISKNVKISKELKEVETAILSLNKKVNAFVDDRKQHISSSLRQEARIKKTDNRCETFSYFIIRKSRGRITVIFA